MTDTGPLEPLASPGGDTLVEERTPSVDDGDHERFAHYVEKDKIVESAVTGKPVTALCGKKWTPGRDPSSSPSAPNARDPCLAAAGRRPTGAWSASPCSRMRSAERMRE